MSGLDICVADITKKFRDQMNLKDFIFDYVWKKNDYCILGYLKGEKPRAFLHFRRANSCFKY